MQHPDSLERSDVMKLKLIVVLVAVGIVSSCSSAQQRVHAKSSWYDAITAYEQRLDRCLEFNEEGEATAYNPELSGCQVTPEEARDVEAVIWAYNDAARLFEEDPAKSSCTMVKAVNVLVKYTDRSFQEQFSTPLVDAYCGATIPNELDLILAGEEAEIAVENLEEE